MAVYANLSIDQGTPFNAAIEVTDRNGDKLDLTGYTGRGQIRRSYASATAVDFEVTFDDPTEGVVILALTDEQTAALKPRRYVYDVEVLDEDGVPTRVVEGQVEVNPRVTRPPEPEE